MRKEERLKDLVQIPGVGNSIATDLWNLGIRTVGDLKGKSPEKLYEESNQLAQAVQDRCLLYVFRCAVYYAETDPTRLEKEKLNWWYWKNKSTEVKPRGSRKPKLLQLLSFAI